MIKNKKNLKPKNLFFKTLVLPDLRGPHILKSIFFGYRHFPAFETKHIQVHRVIFRRDINRM